MRSLNFTTGLSFLATCMGYETTNVNVTMPENNAPYNETLGGYRLEGYNGHSKLLTHGFVKTTCAARLSVHYTEPETFGNATGTKEKPILVLTHGYPESSYIWREVTPDVSHRVPLFVLDQPDYGRSTACCNATACYYDKRTYAQSIMEAVRKIYGDSAVIYAGHDRGARTMQRAATDNDFPGITGLGYWGADIVPFVDEYASFSNPMWATNYWHWSFLPKGGFATDVIMAYGGGNFIHRIVEYGSGLNEAAIETFKAGNSWTIYENFFNQLSVTNASVFDYAAGATVDYDQEIWDQGNGTKIEIPTHIMYSIYNLASGFDVAAVGANWTAPSAGLTTKGVGDDKGHFIIEEAPEQTIEQRHAFMDRLGVSQ